MQIDCVLLYQDLRYISLKCLPASQCNRGGDNGEYDVNCFHWFCIFGRKYNVCVCVCVRSLEMLLLKGLKVIF